MPMRALLLAAVLCAAAGSARGTTCTFQPDTDYDEGDVGQARSFQVMYSTPFRCRWCQQRAGAIH